MYTRRFRSSQPRRQITRRVDPVLLVQQEAPPSSAEFDPVRTARSDAFGSGLVSLARSRADKPVNMKKMQFLFRIFRLRHHGEPARPRLESAAPPQVVRRRPDQGRQGSPHQLAFHAADPHDRVRHRRSPHVEPIRRKRRLLTTAAAASGDGVLMQATAKRTWMRGGGAHARLLRRAALAPDDVLPGRDGDGSAGGRGPVDGEPHGGGHLGRRLEHVDARRGGRPVVAEERRGRGVEAGVGGGREGRRGG